MAGKDGVFARLVSLYRTAYKNHYIPYLYFFYGGEYLHYGSEPTSRIADLPNLTVPEEWVREFREKAP
ncbi:hypothetical protein [Amycolatopsis sp. NPDC059021]|uniref:hypothetical protein n=1 Tax=Amycolatopsis sp. NPDC059021 TaxID=3346704 RepID=UPI00367352FA